MHVFVVDLPLLIKKWFPDAYAHLYPLNNTGCRHVLENLAVLIELFDWLNDFKA